MEMKIIRKEKKLCLSCMEIHEVKNIALEEKSTFKGTPIRYEAEYFYCDNTEEIYSNEEMLKKNDIAMKDAYRKAMGLLTTNEIIAVRKQYGISQSDLCALLGWGGKTIARYESYQVQDKAHDTILRKLAQDPEWFLQLLKERKENLSSTAFEKYVTAATTSYEAAQDSYLRKAIAAKYARIQNQREYNGDANLNLDKAIDVIRYYASSTAVKGLYKVKLMKMLWYGDNLAYKQRDHAITGLAYQALPMGAVPIGHDSIIELKEVPCEEIEMGDGTAYRFKLSTPSVFAALTEEEKEILDKVIKRVGRMTTEEIVNFMHQEEAYKKTKLKDMIDFKYAKELQL